MPIPVPHLVARIPIAFPAVPMTTRDRMLARSPRSSISCTMAHHPHHGLRSLHKAPTDPSLRERHAAWLAVCCLGSVSSIQQKENVLILLPVSAIARHAFPTQLLCATDNKAAIEMETDGLSLRNVSVRSKGASLGSGWSSLRRRISIRVKLELAHCE